MPLKKTNYSWSWHMHEMYLMLYIRSINAEEIDDWL